MQQKRPSRGGGASQNLRTKVVLLRECWCTQATLGARIRCVSVSPAGAGFPFSKWTTNWIEWSKGRDRRGFGWDWGGVEAERRWVRRKKSPLFFSFNGRLKVDFQGSHVTSDG